MPTALANARAYRAQITDFKLQITKAERNLAKAKGEAGLNMEMFASFGLSQTANQFNQAFSNPLDQERVRIGLSLPVADWGKAKSEQETQNVMGEGRATIVRPPYIPIVRLIAFTHVIQLET